MAMISAAKAQAINSMASSWLNPVIRNRIRVALTTAGWPSASWFSTAVNSASSSKNSFGSVIASSIIHPNKSPTRHKCSVGLHASCYLNSVAAFKLNLVHPLQTARQLGATPATLTAVEIQIGRLERQLALAGMQGHRLSLRNHRHLSDKLFPTGDPAAGNADQLVTLALGQLRPLGQREQ